MLFKSFLHNLIRVRLSLLLKLVIGLNLRVDRFRTLVLLIVFRHDSFF